MPFSKFTLFASQWLIVTTLMMHARQRGGKFSAFFSRVFCALVRAKPIHLLCIILCRIILKNLIHIFILCAMCGRIHCCQALVSYHGYWKHFWALKYANQRDGTMNEEDTLVSMLQICLTMSLYECFFLLSHFLTPSHFEFIFYNFSKKNGIFQVPKVIVARNCVCICDACARASWKIPCQKKLTRKINNNNNRIMY